MLGSGKRQCLAKENRDVQIDVQIDVKKLSLDHDNNIIDKTENKNRGDTQNENNIAADDVTEGATVSNNNNRRRKVEEKYSCFKDSYWASSRFTLILMGFFGCINLYALRVNMSVAILCMTDETNTSKVCSYADGNVSKPNTTVGCDIQEVTKLDDVFQWDKTTQGTQIGVLVAFPLSGVLCVDGFDGGWPSVFYVFGCLGVVWFFAWMYLVFDSPMSHPRILVKEREFIVNQLKSELDLNKKSSGTPWRKILTSVPVWAIIVSQTCAEWGTIAFMTNIPTFMEDVLKFDIKKAGFLASLPYLGFWVVSNVSGNLADLLRKRGFVSTTTARKCFNSIGNILPAICIVVVGNVADDPGLAVAMLTLGMAMSGCQYGSGFLVNAVDIAPRYAGVILGISNTTGSIAGFFASIAIGIITVDKTREQWKIVFYITAVIYTFGAIFFIKFASGSVQSWAQDEEQSIDIFVTDDSRKRELKET